MSNEPNYQSNESVNTGSTDESSKDPIAKYAVKEKYTSVDGQPLLHSKPADKAGFWAGFFVGILFTIMVGGGICFGILM